MVDAAEDRRGSVEAEMRRIAAAARQALPALAKAGREAKDSALRAGAASIRASAARITGSIEAPSAPDSLNQWMKRCISASS